MNGESRSCPVLSVVAFAARNGDVGNGDRLSERHPQLEGQQATNRDGGDRNSVQPALKATPTLVHADDMEMGEQVVQPLDIDSNCKCNGFNTISLLHIIS